MNTNTKESLKQFVQAVQSMADAVQHMAKCDGVVTKLTCASDVIDKGDALKAQLDSDDTIP